MTGDALDRIIQEDIAKGLVPCFVCATLGTTSSGAVDDIPAVADVAAKHGMWTHIDAAYAGSCMVLPELRHHLAGVDKVDSIDFNPHKGLLVNFDMSAMYVRDRAPLVRALTLNPEFLRNAATDAGAVTDYKDWQVPLGRRFRALKLWLVLRTYGAEGIRGYMRHHMGLAADFEAWVEADERFEVCADRHFGLVCFRLRGAPDAANAELLERLNATGKTFLTGTSLDGKFTLRLAVGGTNTGAVHVAECWQLICEEAEAVLKEAAGAN
ncbi:unnamed protein product [Pedinophyceae sp. YPF-701]|nr:unnamed protein product [Pedinophyceae sp. YPF-701]